MRAAILCLSTNGEEGLMQQIINHLLNRKPTTNAEQSQRDCNFRDNYYGDQLCKEVVTEQAPKA
tara:strand:- start:273 stop:464 length:192 start_codon:yes stop_codon:yes gene_type:complete